MIYKDLERQVLAYTKSLSNEERKEQYETIDLMTEMMWWMCDESNREMWDAFNYLESQFTEYEYGHNILKFIIDTSHITKEDYNYRLAFIETLQKHNRPLNMDVLKYLSSSKYFFKFSQEIAGRVLNYTGTHVRLDKGFSSYSRVIGTLDKQVNMMKGRLHEYRYGASQKIFFEIKRLDLSTDYIESDEWIYIKYGSMVVPIERCIGYMSFSIKLLDKAVKSYKEYIKPILEVQKPA